MSEEKLQRPVPTKIRVEPPFPEYPFQPEPIPKFKSEEVEELEKLIPAPFPAKEVIKPTLTQEVKDRGYKNFEVDLSVAHTDMALGLRALGIVATSMCIIRTDSPFDYRLNSPSNDATPAEKGLEEDQFELEEIYITNAAATGKALIRCVWNPRLIRPT